jgi:hypothetical protein
MCENVLTVEKNFSTVTREVPTMCYSQVIYRMCINYRSYLDSNEIIPTLILWLCKDTDSTTSFIIASTEKR